MCLPLSRLVIAHERTVAISWSQLRESSAHPKGRRDDLRGDWFRPMHCLLIGFRRNCIAAGVAMSPAWL